MLSDIFDGDEGNANAYDGFAAVYDRNGKLEHGIVYKGWRYDPYQRLYPLGSFRSDRGRCYQNSSMHNGLMPVQQDVDARGWCGREKPTAKAMEDP